MIDVVVPTIGRPSLARLLDSLARAAGPLPQHVIVVDDRKDRSAPLELGNQPDKFRARIAILSGPARGPAAARNVGWRESRATWVAFLDDDVLVDERWLAELADDLHGLAIDVAASTGRVRVPLPTDRRATDWERNVAALERARWITADCAYRRSELLATGGFDERFPRAFREDADLALRVIARGQRIVAGKRSIAHPVRPAPWWISIRLQAGNEDDVLMSAIHGQNWRERAGEDRGAFPAHVATVGAALVALGACVARKPLVSALGVGAWALLTGAFAWRRIAPGPRAFNEILSLIATSAVIPFAAVYHSVQARLRLRTLLSDHRRAPRPTAAAVLFDRDGTLIEDIPLNVDPARVTPMPHAFAALERLRDAGLATAVVSNQSAVALGLLQRDDVDAINAQVDALLGPLGPMFVCPHAADDGCACRKPAPGLVEEAAFALGVAARDCVLVGDIGADLDAARAAGARAILVATPVTRREEIVRAPRVSATLNDAVSAILDGSA